VVKTVHKSKETLKECFEKLQITRNEATMSSHRTALYDEWQRLKIWTNIFHCIMPHLYTLYNQLPHGNDNSTSTYKERMNCLTCLPQTQSSFSHSQTGKPSSKEKERHYTKPYLRKTACAILLSIRWKWSARSPISSKVV